MNREEFIAKVAEIALIECVALDRFYANTFGAQFQAPRPKLAVTSSGRLVEIR